MIEEKTFYQNPKVEYLFGTFGYGPIPTKQDKFKPIDIIGVDESGKEKILKDFYQKKPDRDALIEFNHYIQKLAKEYFDEKTIIKKPQSVEVVLSMTINESRFKIVDVDNLAKAVLDCLIGIAFEDDSQVTSLICKKYIHPHNTDGILIGITRLTKNNLGFGSDIILCKPSKWI